jgi:predicted small secreted protein
MFLGTNRNRSGTADAQNSGSLLFNLFLLSGSAAFLSACNTAASAGEDISATGNAITGGADQSKPHY